MQVTLLWAAAVVSVITFAIHTFIGGPRVAKPLLANNDLSKASKWLNYFCWHMVTIYTFSMSGAYAYVAIYPERFELIIFLTVLNTSFAILSTAIAMKGKIHPLRFPSTSLFTILSGLGILSMIFN